LSNVAFKATVSGTATGPINYTFYCNRDDSGTNITPNYNHKKDNTTLNPYEASNVCTYSLPGIYTAKAIVERGALAAEARVTVTVSPPPAGPIDLKVTDIKFYNEEGVGITTIPANKIVIVDASVVNQGTAATGRDFKVKWFIDGAEVNYAMQPQLGAGETAEKFMFCAYLWNTPAGGTHTIQFQADADSQISETNETNNSLSKTVTIGVPIQ